MYGTVILCLRLEKREGLLHAQNGVRSQDYHSDQVRYTWISVEKETSGISSHKTFTVAGGKAIKEYRVLPAEQVGRL